MSIRPSAKNREVTGLYSSRKREEQIIISIIIEARHTDGVNADADINSIIAGTIAKRFIFLFKKKYFENIIKKENNIDICSPDTATICDMPEYENC